jgi:hypothetical protein
MCIKSAFWFISMNESSQQLLGVADSDLTLQLSLDSVLYFTWCLNINLCSKLFVTLWLPMLSLMLLGFLCKVNWLMGIFSGLISWNHSNKTSTPSFPAGFMLLPSLPHPTFFLLYSTFNFSFHYCVVCNTVLLRVDGTIPRQPFLCATCVD